MITRSKSKMTETTSQEKLPGSHKQTDPYDELESASHISNTSSASLMRLKEDQRRAELSVKAASLSERYELELKRKQFEIQHKRKQQLMRLEQQRLDEEADISKLELKRLEDEVSLRAEIAISDAKLDVLDKFEDSSLANRLKLPPPLREQSPVASHEQVVDQVYGNVPAETNVMCDDTTPPIYTNECTNFVPSGTPLTRVREPLVTFQVDPSVHPKGPTFTSTPTVLNTSAMPFKPAQHSTQMHMQSAPMNTYSYQPDNTRCSDNDLSRLADILSNNQNYLPKMEPDVFKGDVLQYAQWSSSFEAIIEDRVKSDTNRLYYLSKYTGGPAKDAIQGLLTLKTPEAYLDARAILSERFGDKYLIYETYRDKIRKWPTIKPNDGIEMRRFSDFLCNCQTAMASVHYLTVLDDAEENQKILSKLPRYTIDRWSRVVDSWLHGKEAGDNTPRYPPFSAFCSFLKKEARVACGPVKRDNAVRNSDVSIQNQYRRNNNQNANCKSFATRIEHAPVKDMSILSNNIKSRTCTVCKGDHIIENCPQFLSQTPQERHITVRNKMLCLRCLKWGHMGKDCRGKRTCDTCNSQFHATLLHAFFQTAKSVQTHHTETGHDTAQKSDCFHSLILPVYLHTKKHPHNKVIVYALLDPQSNACFISTETMNAISVTGESTKLKLRTMHGENVIHSQRIRDLVISDMNNATIINLPECYSRDEIASNHDQIPRYDTVRRWPHLATIADELHPYMKDIEIGLLIGTNLSRVMKPRHCIPGQGNDPYAIKTELGWGVIGLVNQPAGGHDTYCLSVSAEERKCYFSYKTHVKEINDQVTRMFARDFNEKESCDSTSMSVQDRKFLATLESGVHQRADGHFEMPLPFKNEDTCLPNNRAIVVKRLCGLKRKLSANTAYKKDYTTFMSNLIEKGYAERVIPETHDEASGHVWYIPHHGIYNPHKPGKIRIVFDCSVEFKGHSLNSHLLPGPDLINSLTGVLCRFRKEQVAFCCDIEAMFHQVGVNPEDRNYLRFLWWEDGLIEREPVEYRMTVHLFGGTSSPGCANFALKHAAELFESTYGSEAANFVKRDFYVDDGLTSVESPDQAKALMKSSWQLCEQGGFNLCKFICNNKQVVSDLPADRRAKNVQTVDFLMGELPVEKTLGVEWCVEADTFQFRVTFQDKPATRRGILSSVSSIFDPLGLLSPVILMGKRIMQDLCQTNMGWDEPLSDAFVHRWNMWKEEVLSLSALSIPRCYKPKQYGVIKSVELHHFCDASLSGYGVCSYLRMVDVDGRIATVLVMAKSRVTPNKSVTVPRLELTAAVLSVQVGSFLEKELQYSDVKSYFWSDSKVVLGYIANESRRFHIFVANRVQKIRDHSAPDQWHYVESKDNPADVASRGAKAVELLASELWWKGPTFLSSTNPFPPRTLPIELQQNDPEVKTFTSMATNVSETLADIPSRMEYFSCWHRAKRAIAVCLRFRQRLRDRSLKKSKEKANLNDYVPVTVADMQKAEHVLISGIQQSVFSEEINTLRKLKLRDCDNADLSKRKRNDVLAVKASSCLSKLDPFVDDKGILRVGGRIRKASLPTDIIHPVILPRKCHVTRLLVLHYHMKTSHSGRGITLNEIRSSGYWIISGRSAVIEHIRNCVTCSKLRGPPLGQKMGNLPPDRLEPAAPFTYSAVDIFGPFYIKRARSEIKRYGALFTCLSSRAVHIEIVDNLSTDSFINAYRRFLCRRGPIRQLRSDQGTNIAGAKSQQEASLNEMDHDKIRQELLKENCDWIIYEMNVPHSSHMGGVWERMIRTVRNVLAWLLDKNGHQLDDELLRTLMAEAEAIVNCRPLTCDELSSADSPQPLSPNQLLVLKSKVVPPPPGVFVREDLYCNRRWRRVQYLANQFWSRWKAEYLMMLQERNKWTRPQKNLMKGDIVLMITENEPRNMWPMACVVDTYPGEDGYLRKVKVAVGQTTYDRPVHKLVLLMSRGIPVQEPKED